MSGPDQYDVRHITYDGRRCIKIDAGHRGWERIVPPAGEKHAFDRQHWARSVEVYISRTGRSVRVYVDGEEVKDDTGSRPE